MGPVFIKLFGNDSKTFAASLFSASKQLSPARQTIQGERKEGVSMLSRIRKIIISAAAFSVLMIAAPLAVGQAPDFSFRAVDGPAVTSESLRGEVVVLAFGASWLPLTKNQVEGLKKLADQYAARGVAVYWISTESDSPKSKNFVSDEELRELGRKYKMSVLRDPDGPVSRRLGVDQLPATVIINKQGQIAATLGGLDPSADLAKQLAERLDKML
jgi:peroxiredoxin